MPPKLVSLAILVYWSIAAFLLLTWEVLPELTLGYPPDLRAIATAGEDQAPAYWEMYVVDDPRRPETRRSVGLAVTATRRQPDNWVEMTSDVDFDAGGLLKTMPFAGDRASVRVSLKSVYKVDPSGSLRSFDMKISAPDSGEDLVKVEGRLHGGMMKVTATGITSLLNQKYEFPYEPRGVVHDALRPLDRLPGLHVGQRWDMRIVNPLSGAAETARVEVKRRVLIDWNGEAVSAFEVEQRSKAVTAKTWVRLDGLIVRQEVPLPLVHMILERLPGKPLRATGSAAVVAPAGKETP